MKKIISSICLMAVCIGMFAGNPFKITMGKQNVRNLMKETAIAVVEYDWSGTMYDNKVTAEEKFATDYDFVVSHCQSNFVSGFNGASKGLRLSNEANADAKYKMTLKVTNLDSFFAAMRFVPRHEGKMWGKVSVMSIATGEPVFEATIDEAEDGCDCIWRECFGKTFAEMGKNMTKIK